MKAEVFSRLLLLLWRYCAQKLFVFALSPLRLARGSAKYPPSRSGAMKVALRCFKPKLARQRILFSKFGFENDIPRRLSFNERHADLHRPTPGGGVRAALCQAQGGECE